MFSLSSCCTGPIYALLVDYEYILKNAFLLLPFFSSLLFLIHNVKYLTQFIYLFLWNSRTHTCVIIIIVISKTEWRKNCHILWFLSNNFHFVHSKGKKFLSLLFMVSNCVHPFSLFHPIHVHHISHYHFTSFLFYINKNTHIQSDIVCISYTIYSTFAHVCLCVCAYMEKEYIKYLAKKPKLVYVRVSVSGYVENKKKIRVKIKMEKWKQKFTLIIVYCVPYINLQKQRRIRKSTQP